MKKNFETMLLLLLLMLPIISLLNGCNSIQGSDRRIPNVGKMDDPSEAELNGMQSQLVY